MEMMTRQLNSAGKPSGLQHQVLSCLVPWMQVLSLSPRWKGAPPLQVAVAAKSCQVLIHPSAHAQNDPCAAPCCLHCRIIAQCLHILESNPSIICTFLS